MKTMLHAYAMCQSMFCAIPCPWKIWDEKAKTHMLLFLPLVGLEIGVIWAMLAWACGFLQLPTLIGALVLCAYPYIATGFIHLDGFMDVTDAVRSWRDLERRREILKDSHVGSFAVIGTPVPEKGKLKAPDARLLDTLMEEADVVFIEADGSKHCPIKVPREGEPVFHDRSDLVIAVMGLSAVGKPLYECCFGLTGATELLDTAADHILTAADAAKILSSELGSRKDLGNREFCVVLNQCDDGKRRRTADEIAMWLREFGVDQVVMTAFDPEERVQYDAISKG